MRATSYSYFLFIVFWRAIYMHWKPRLNQAQNSISLRLKSAMWVLFDVSNKWNLKLILLLRQGIQQNFSVFFVWACRKNHKSARGIQWWTQMMWLVFATVWTATMVYHFLIGHAKPREIVQLSGHLVRERNIEGGTLTQDSFWFTRFNFSSPLQFINKAFFHISWHCENLDYSLMEL